MSKNRRKSRGRSRPRSRSSSECSRAPTMRGSASKGSRKWYVGGVMF